MSNEARIRLGIDGASGVSSTLKKVVSDLTNLEVSAKSISGTIKDVGAGFVRLGIDYAKVASGLKSTNFGEVAQNFKKYDEQITRMAIRGGKNVDELRVKMRDAGRSAGVTGAEFAKSVKAFDRMSLSGLDESTEAMRALGTYATDTDRSLEEMLEFGDAMWTKLGIPAQKFQSELNKIKSISNDIGLASGFLGIERSLIRLSPLLKTFSAGRSGATLGAGLIGAARETGLSGQAAEDAVGKILSGIESVPYPLILRAYRQYKNDPTADPAETTATGEVGYRGVSFLKFVREQMLKAPSTAGALYGLLGNKVTDQAAMRLFMRPGYLERAEQLADVSELRDDLASLEEERRRKQAAHPMLRGAPPERGIAKIFREDAGKRIIDDLDRESIDARTGENLTRAQDRVRDTLSAGQRAKLGMVLPYMPPDVQDMAYGAVGAYGAATAKPAPGPSPMDTRRLEDAVSRGISTGMRQTTIEVKPQARAAHDQAAKAALVN